MAALTDREEKFCQSYVREGVAHRAAIEAGYSAAVARAKSGFILKRPQVAKRIAELRERMDRMAVRSSVDVINELSRLAFNDALSFMKPDPEAPGLWVFKAPDELTTDQRAAVASVQTVNVRAGENPNGSDRFVQHYTYTFHDKITALVQMGRHYGLFDDRLRLEKPNKNRFSNLTTEQLNELRSKIVRFIVTTQGDRPALEGQVIEPAKAKARVSDDRRRS